MVQMTGCGKNWIHSPLLGLKREKEVKEPGDVGGFFLESRKSKSMDSPLELPEGNMALPIP